METLSDEDGGAAWRGRPICDVGAPAGLGYPERATEAGIALAYSLPYPHSGGRSAQGPGHPQAGRLADYGVGSLG